MYDILKKVVLSIHGGMSKGGSIDVLRNEPNNRNVVFRGVCYVVDSKTSARREVDLPLEMECCIREYRGSRSLDSTIEVFIAKVVRFNAVDANATPKLTKSKLSVLLPENSIIVVMYDLLEDRGCICQVRLNSGLSYNLFRPEIFKEYDPEAEAADVDLTVQDAEIKQLLKFLGAMNDGSGGSGSGDSGQKDEANPTAELAEQPQHREFVPADETLPEPEKQPRNYEELSDEVPPGGGLSEREIAMVLDGMNLDDNNNSGERPEEAGGEQHQKPVATGGDNASGASNGTKNRGRGGW